MTYPAYPQRVLTTEEIDTFRRDGVVMIKGLLQENWLSLMEAGVEQARKEASLMGKAMSAKSRGYQMDAFLWKRIDALRDLIYYSPFARWAQQLLDSKEIRFFYDQMFVKEPGTDAPTPWHQDTTFWPLEGNQICSFWVPLDPVTRANSGLQYVKGSHRWPNRFKAISPDYNSALLEDDSLDDVPDINANPDKYESTCWDMEPGDVLIFHPLTLHGSSGNTTRDKMRRALALRWLGDDVRFAPSDTRMPIAYEHDSIDGGPVTGGAFPRILPEHIQAERALRSSGPESMKASTIGKSAWKTLRAAMKQRLKGMDKGELKQTW
jgi:ectoine hydroxylase-related dioxygenase (phytanoyl-CoA dioxygenase family)